MSSRRQILELGVFGRVPVDTLFQMYIETRRGDTLTISQTKCQASIGGWVRTYITIIGNLITEAHQRRVTARQQSISLYSPVNLLYSRSFKQASKQARTIKVSNFKVIYFENQCNTIS